LELLRTSGPSANDGRSAVLKVGDQEINVFYHSDFVSADKETPAGVDHFCFSMRRQGVARSLVGAVES